MTIARIEKSDPLAGFVIKHVLVEGFDLQYLIGVKFMLNPNFICYSGLWRKVGIAKELVGSLCR